MPMSPELLQVIHGNTPKSAMVNEEKISHLPKRIVKPGISRQKCFKSIVLFLSPHKRSRLSKTTNSSNAANKKLIKKFAKEQISSKTANQVFASLVCGGCENEDWIQCHKCQEWAHEKCADLTDARFYHCDNCV